MIIATLCFISFSLHGSGATAFAAAHTPGLAAGPARSPASQTTGATPSETVRKTPQKASASQINEMLVEKQYLDLEGALKAWPEIPAVQRAFFEGVLANRENRIIDSLRELELALADPASPLAPDQQTVALHTLADDYAKSFRYGDAATTYARLLGSKDSSLTEAERKDIDGSRQTMELLRGAPTQTVTFHDAFKLATKQNALGLADVEVIANGRPESWILDTGANLSLVTASEARRLGLKVSQGTAPLAGPGGKVVFAHAAVISEVKLGTATFRHMAVLVVEDKDFYIPQAKFHFTAILGYPALSSLGSITLYNNGGFAARKPLASSKDRGSQMMMEGLAPLVTVTIGKTRRLFLLDTGAERTYLIARYWQEHKNEFVGQQTHNMEIGGAGGSRTLPAYTARNVAMDAGGVHIALGNVSVLSKAAGTNADYFYGVLGQDALKLFGSCTLDFRNMRYVCTRNTAASRKSGDEDHDDD